MRSDVKFHETKVPEVTLGFWVIKILATTLGETGGDTVTMTWLKADVMVNAGYLVGSAIFLSALIVLVVIQIVAKKFHPFSSGPPSWPPRQPVRRWPILQPAPWASATLAGLSSCLPVSWPCSVRGIGPRALSQSKRSARPRSKPSTGRRLHFPRHWAPLLATGSPTQAVSAIKVEPSCSPLDWQLLWHSIPRQTYKPWWTCLEPSNRFRGDRGDHDRARSPHSTVHPKVRASTA